METISGEETELNRSAQFRLADFTAQAELELTRLLYGRGLAGVFANTVNSLLVAVVLWGDVPTPRLVVWLGVVWLLTGLRYYMIDVFHRASVGKESSRKWQTRMIGFLFALGLAWGSLGVFLFPEDTVHQVFLAYVLGGMCAGAVAVDSALFTAFMAFAIPAVAPIGARFIILFDHIHLVMGLMSFVYLGVLAMVARHIYSTTEKSIYLDFERTEQKLKAERLNEKLTQEVAERRAAEERLRQERDIFMGGPVVVFKWRAAEGWPVEYVSPNVSQFGYPPEDLTGGKILFAQMVSIKDLKRVMDEVGAHARNGDGSFAQVYRIVTPAGEERWVEDFTVVIRDAGKITHYHGYVTDVSDKKKFQDELRESEQRNRLLVELSPYAIVVHAGGKIMYANPAGARLMGGEGVEEFVGRNVMDFIHPGSVEVATARLKALYQQDVNLPPSQQKFIKKNGDVIDVDVVSAPFTFKGSPAAMSIFSDVTYRKTAEDARKKLIKELGEVLDKAEKERKKAEEATKLKDKFISLVSHDLRSPLSSILAVLRMIHDDTAAPVNPQHKDMIGSVMESGQRLMTMIDELLNLSRLKTGNMEMRPCFVDAAMICGNVVENNLFMAQKKGIELIGEIKPGHRIYADPALFGQALQNLVSNAVKFCSKGDKVTLFIPEGEKAAVAVRDTGMGVEPSFIPDLFRQEIRTTGVGSAGETGTGLGLPFSHDIMRAHGGTLEVESSPGKGSTFTARLPRVRPLIMLVDDDSVTRSILADILQRADMDCIQAGDGIEALEKLKETSPHLVVVDLLMPVMNGFEFLKAYGALKNIRKIPVMTLTSDDKPETRDKAFQLGAADFIHKSLVKTDFIPRVNRLLSSWKLF
jgi:PAS domain S-box-containing protein